MNVCNVCGLPKELCVCEQMNSQQRKMFVAEKRVKGSKYITEINGFDNPKEMEDLFKGLKRDFACGGTIKKGVIELQGKHAKKVVEFLSSKGYSIERN